MFVNWTCFFFGRVEPSSCSKVTFSPEEPPPHLRCDSSVTQCPCLPPKKKKKTFIRLSLSCSPSGCDELDQPLLSPLLMRGSPPTYPVPPRRWQQRGAPAASPVKGENTPRVHRLLLSLSWPHSHFLPHLTCCHSATVGCVQEQLRLRSGAAEGCINEQRKAAFRSS